MGILSTDEDVKNIPASGKKGKAQIYNLAEDVGEKKNLIATEKERAKKMQALLTKLVKSKKGVRHELQGQ